MSENFDLPRLSVMLPACRRGASLIQFTVAVVRTEAMVSANVAAVNQPRVLQETIEMVLTDDGIHP
jgi:hypothetical protein